LKNEQQQIEEQFALEREIAPKLRAYVEGNTEDPNALRLELVRAMSGLKNQAAAIKSQAKRLIYARAYEDLRVQAIENGQHELEAKHFAMAEGCFQLVSQFSDDPWARLLLAETHAASGNVRQSIRDLEDAVRHGLKDFELLQSDPHLQVIKSEPGFLKIIADLKRSN
jgi:dGTP triphosphohydrolase